MSAGLDSFEMHMQSLTDAVQFETNELSVAETSIAACGGEEATAEEDLEITSRYLKRDMTAQADIHHVCMTTAQAYEAGTARRGNRLLVRASTLTSADALQRTALLPGPKKCARARLGFGRIVEVPRMMTVKSCSQAWLGRKPAIHGTAFQTIMESDVDISRDLYSNVVLSGGTARFLDIGERLTGELTARAPSAMVVQVQPVCTVRASED